MFQSLNPLNNDSKWNMLRYAVEMYQTKKKKKKKKKDKLFSFVCLALEIQYEGVNKYSKLYLGHCVTKRIIYALFKYYFNSPAPVDHLLNVTRLGTFVRRAITQVHLNGCNGSKCSGHPKVHTGAIVEGFRVCVGGEGGGGGGGGGGASRAPSL